MECYYDEFDSNKSSTRELTKNTNNHKRSSDGGGGSSGGGVEAIKRRRGRPPGSKNKRKRPVNNVGTATAAEPSITTCTHILEIPAGRDVAAALAAFSRVRRVGLCVLAASGPVAGVTLRGAAGAITLRGQFDILSVSAAFLPPPAAGAGGLSVTVAGPQGRVAGGVVAGPLVAAGTVVVVAAVFYAAAFHQLPGEADVSDALLHHRGGHGGGDRTRIDGNNINDDEEQKGQNRNNDSNRPNESADAVSFYRAHFPPDFLWAPAATRPPNRPPPY